MARKDRRAEMVAAAQKFFYTKGYENTSISDILDAVGMSRGAFYHHFESKQAVLAAVIDVMAVETRSIIEPVMDDTTLTAIERYQQLAHVINEQRLAESAGMTEIWRALQSDENLRLMRYIHASAAEVFVPVLSTIIKQGIEEGVFAVEFVQETAGLMLGISQLTQTAVADLLLNPDQYDNPAVLATQKITTAQTAVDRLVGAPLGALLLIHKAAIAAYFATYSAHGGST